VFHENVMPVGQSAGGFDFLLFQKGGQSFGRFTVHKK